LEGRKGWGWFAFSIVPTCGRHKAILSAHQTGGIPTSTNLFVMHHKTTTGKATLGIWWLVADRGMSTVERVKTEIRRTYENHSNFQLKTLPKQLLKNGWITTHTCTQKM